MDDDEQMVAPRAYPGGRPAGSRNYSGTSVIARTFKERGIAWMDELISAYLAYKADPTQANALLMDYWVDMLPYLTVKMIEKETRGERPRHKRRRRISTAALDQLAQAEGRKP